MEKSRNILVLGCGMMVEPLIDYLLKRTENKIIIGTNMFAAAQKILHKKKNLNISAEELDILKDLDKLTVLVSKSDLVVSYVPPFLHINVAKVCLAEKKNMITTSYVSDSLNNMNAIVKEAGLIFMNEVGLDPGLDHIITHKVLLEANKRGDKIIHYESWCGALCSPEFVDNPLLHKFTWAPRGALIAMKNNASQYINEKQVDIPSNDLLKNTVNKNFHSCFNFEGYFNRDSLVYKEMYNLKDAETVIRGTIRFKGFAFIFQCFKHLGLFDEVNIDEIIDNWRKFFTKLMNEEKNTESISHMKQKFIRSENDDLYITTGLNDSAEIDFYYTLSLLSLSKFSDEYIKENEGFPNLFSKIFYSLKYLDLYNDNNKLQSRQLLDAFAFMLEDKLKLQEWERDLVFMQNSFKLIDNEGRFINKKYDMLVFGGHNNLPYSAVSLLVSMPCAITAQLILDGKIKETGVLRPTSEEIIKGVLEEMEKLNIYLIEHAEQRAKF